MVNRLRFNANLVRKVRGGYMKQLDGLRALAAIGVIFHHFRAQDTNVPLVGFAGTGVWLFFILSGFLVTGILVDARSDAEGAGQGIGRVVKAFYMRRALRIFPIYYGLLGLATWLNLKDIRSNFAWFALFQFNNHVAIYGPRSHNWGGSLIHFWTLCVEEQFYFVWPAVALFAPRRSLRAILITVIVMAPVLRMVQMTVMGTSGVFFTFSNVDALAAGALLALLWRGETVFGRSCNQLLAATPWLALLAWACTSALGYLHMGERVQFAIGSIWLTLVYVWLVDRAAVGFPGAGRLILANRPLTYLGRISYGMYAIHLLVPDLVLASERWTGVNFHLPAENGVPRVLYVLAATTLLASLSFFIYENPLNNLKVYFPYVRRNVSPAPHRAAPELTPLGPLSASRDT